MYPQDFKEKRLDFMQTPEDFMPKRSNSQAQAQAQGDKMYPNQGGKMYPNQPELT